MAAMADILAHRLKPARVPGIVRRAARRRTADRTMLEVIAADEHEWLLESVRRVVRLRVHGVNAVEPPAVGCSASCAAVTTCASPIPAGTDPLTGEFAKARGGRWNPPGAFAVVYLNRDEAVARANVLRGCLRAGRIGPEDLEPAAGARCW